jgi:hypothetical protein
VDSMDCSVRLAPSAGGVTRSIDLTLLHLHQFSLFSSLPPPIGAMNPPRFEVASQPSQRRHPSNLHSTIERGPTCPPLAAAGWPDLSSLLLLRSQAWQGPRSVLSRQRRGTWRWPPTLWCRGTRCSGWSEDQECLPSHDPQVSNALGFAHSACCTGGSE